MIEYNVVSKDELEIKYGRPGLHTTNQIVEDNWYTTNSQVIGLLLKELSVNFTPTHLVITKNIITYVPSLGGVKLSYDCNNLSLIRDREVYILANCFEMTPVMERFLIELFKGMKSQSSKKSTELHQQMTKSGLDVKELKFEFQHLPMNGLHGISIYEKRGEEVDYQLVSIGQILETI